jgi:hypothetical protein
MAWAACAAIAGTDQIWIKSGNGAGKPLAFQGTVTRMEGDTVYFTSSSGSETSRPLASVVELNIDSEPLLNQAEAAYTAATPDWDTACTAYNSEITATDKEWLRNYCRIRLIDAAGHNGQVDLATSAYIYFVQNNPAVAADHTPKIPDSGARGLDEAAALLSNAVDGAGIAADQQRQLLSLLLAVDKARGDDKDVAKIAQRLTGEPAAPGDSNSSSSAEVQVSVAQSSLQLAKVARDDKDYAGALKLIQDNRTAFSDQASQVEAMFIIAQCKEALAKSDDDLKDAAIAYMRVYTHFKQSGDVDFVPQSLLNTGHILERLKDPQPKQAYDAYQTIIANFRTTPWAADAQKDCDRLRAAGLRLD